MKISALLRKIDGPLLLVLLLAALVRFWGIRFGIPQLTARPDELNLMELAIQMCRGDLNPHLFLYPTLFIYTLLSAFLVYYLWGSLTGSFAHLAEMVQNFWLYPHNYLIFGRIISGVLGVLTVLMVYQTTRRLAGRRTALIAAFFLALAYLHVRDSHFGVTDVPATFFIVCSVLYIIKASEDNSLKNYLLAGFFAGLAAAVKYNGILLIVPIFLVNLFHTLEEKKKKISLFFDKKLWSFGVMLLLVFFITTPYALLDYTEFIRDSTLQWWIINYGSGDFLGRAWWYHLKFTLFYGLGWPLLGAGLAGIVVVLRADFKKGLIFLSFPIIYYLIGFKAYAVYLRYAIPLIPFLCITAAVFIAFIGEKLEAKIAPPFKKYLVYLLAMLTILPSLINVIKFDRLICRQDNRIIASDWINSHLQKNATLQQIGSAWGRILLKDFKQLPYDNRPLKTNLEIVGLKELPRYLVVQTYPLKVYNTIPAAVKKIIKERYVHIKAFPAINMNNKDNLFDHVDAFYVPFVGMQGVIRPGPNMDIYELKRD